MVLEQLKEAVIQMDDKKLKNLITQALASHITPEEILDKGLIAGMKEVGELFTKKEYFVPEVLLASEAFYAGFNIISPLLKKQKLMAKAKVVIGVVEGDIHDIGKNIVKVLIKASGYEVIDLGTDVPTHKFIDTVVKEKPAIIALSSLMTTTMENMKKIIHVLDKKGLRNTVKVIIGGAPVTEAFARKIKADGYGKDAADAVNLVQRLVDE